MSVRCTGPDNVARNVDWRFIKGAWVASITVCDQTLYSYIPVKCEDGETIIDNECVSILPVLTTDDVNVFGLSVQVIGTITSEGASDVSEYGIVYSQTDPPTIEDTKVIVGTASFTGEFEEDIDFDFEENEIVHYFRAYATNSDGTAYGESISGTPFLCLIKGTQITLATGKTKAIEDITYEDDLLVWNFDETKFDFAKPVWIAKKFSMPSYNVVKFSDGSRLGTIDGLEGHSIFNVQKGMFTHLNADETPVGTSTFNENGQTINLIGHETIQEEISFYNVITYSHMNLFANGILTSSKLNNLYQINDMEFIKINREARDRDEFNVSDEMFHGLRLAEQPMSSPNLEKKVAMMMRKKA